jgi:hypothetical protein
MVKSALGTSDADMKSQLPRSESCCRCAYFFSSFVELVLGGLLVGLCREPRHAQGGLFRVNASLPRILARRTEGHQGSCAGGVLDFVFIDFARLG